MKKIFFAFAVSIVLLLTGCLELTQEINISEDGSGTISNSTDMGQVLALARQMGGSDDQLPPGAEDKVDTSFSLAAQADKDSSLSAIEKAILAKSSLAVNMDLKSDKMKTTATLPFGKNDELGTVIALSSKVMEKRIGQAMGGNGAQLPGMDQMPAPRSIDDFYTVKSTPGSLVRTVNKETIASAQTDQYLVSMKEATAMGAPMKITYIINLPRAAKKAEGKNVKLSEDKKKVTVFATVDEFLDDPSVFEYNISY